MVRTKQKRREECIISKNKTEEVERSTLLARTKQKR